MTVLTYNYMAVLNSGNNYDCIININIICLTDNNCAQFMNTCRTFAKVLVYHKNLGLSMSTSLKLMIKIRFSIGN